MSVRLSDCELVAYHQDRSADLPCEYVAELWRIDRGPNAGKWMLKLGNLGGDIASPRGAGYHEEYELVSAESAPTLQEQIDSAIKGLWWPDRSFQRISVDEDISVDERRRQVIAVCDRANGLAR
jgi:hypothetical protein